MRLARPDVRHPRIVLAEKSGADAESLVGNGDDDGLVGALRGRGLPAHWTAWDDPDTARADLVILRSTDDDSMLGDRRDEFLAWTRRVPNLLNMPDVIAWNADEQHLQDLTRAGVPMRSATPAESPTALIFLAGTQSHAFTGGSPVDADFELWDVGYSALDAAADRVGISPTELLYARVEVIGGPGDVHLVDVDLIAPALGWQLLGNDARTNAQRQFALGVQSALERLGLGPLSHRRP
ncbi:MAG TPA: hypothetical protein VMS16_02060 [Mycobacterium sp.]|nr:hypothetical protein [Mycobacterium sp.]